MNRLPEDAPTTVGDLRMLPNFGVASLIDFMCVVEAGLESRFLSAANSASPADAPPTKTATTTPPDPEPPLAGHSVAGQAFEKVFSAAQEFRGAKTLGDALRGDLSSLAEALGVAGELDEIPIAEIVSGLSMAEQLVLAIAHLRRSLQQSEAKQLILETRIFADDPETLGQIANRVSVSRERIRQLEKEIKATVESEIRPLGDTISTLLAERLAPVSSAEALEEQIDAVLSSTATRDSPEEDRAAARRLVRGTLAYSCVDGVCLSSEAGKVAEGLHSAARESADDAGLVEEARLRAALPDESWQQHWDALVNRSGLHRLSGHLALRDTAKAKAKAALLQIGRPATREEIAELSGLALDRVGAQMSLLPSIVRADKERWGLAEWVDDEYEGIPAEIVQRIDEDGGATRLERLLKELPDRFGVSELSVRAYVGTPRFVLRDGFVSLADESSIVLRPLEDVVHGRDHVNRPYWRFKVEARYFDGYSLAGLPPEVAKALGCEPDSRARVPLSFPASGGGLSVGWKLASPSGPSLGYLAEPLRRLGAQAGDYVHLVLEGPAQASLRLEGDSTPLNGVSDADSIGHGHSPLESETPDRGRILLERMKNRRRGF